MTLDARIADVTDAIVTRSRDSRARYLDGVAEQAAAGPYRAALSCGNLAHGFAGCGATDKEALKGQAVPNIGVVTAYNDMLSAHQPYERFPELIRATARRAGAVAQVAGGVPAMCDGVTQGRLGMELSLFSRDVIAMSTAVALSHDMFDAALYLGICDKIVPGLVIGALAFGHLPAVFVPSGPMPSGMSNDEKGRIRGLYAERKIGRAELLEAESASYHSPGTCTFYGTANSNQMLMEIMGLHLPGASFVPPNTPLRDALTRAAVTQALAITRSGNGYAPISQILDEKAFVNGIVGLNATGGSTNHAIHLVAMAKAAGIQLTWDDFDRLSAATPLLCRIYPNGSADVNHFHAAGGMGYLIRELRGAGLLHDDVLTVMGSGLADYEKEPALVGDEVVWTDGAPTSGDATVLRPASEPFQADGGLRVLTGNLGRSVIKVSAVDRDRWVVEAPARVFTSQDDLEAAFRAGELDRDVVVVVRFQGPKANGMPELHRLTPSLAVLQKRGHKVALVTDGRMSGASGKVPAAIHVTPEAAHGGPIARLRDGDVVRLDAEAGTLAVLTPAEEFDAREAETRATEPQFGMGRNLFAAFRARVDSAEQGATPF
ncbi:phosphogluconate dehydratase [Methylopila jiangsuensis]|uniref:Phosphogluconate dehydratase n=1 Tax=Methylopila jiangsuensis TaxID=586230 RepID=A0A9W6JGM5_9HYPH|nr:phosphogluconate dehydratase [Methylopila jiangsuensis]MDR6286413.1 phosphogluconate dehydratase [Methylopila jiangsuensis]GLK77250.1 phosphogluconate dehydratase [Methylopila jiangsuensis]